MSVQTEIIALTESTTALLNAVNTYLNSVDGIFHTVFVDSSINPTQVLPENGAATRYRKIDSGAAHIIFLPTTGRTIEGMDSYDGLSVQNEWIVFGLFGSDWKVIG